MSASDLMEPGRLDIEAIARALGESPAVAYSTSHVYPWAAPNFAKRPGGSASARASSRFASTRTSRSAATLLVLLLRGRVGASAADDAALRRGGRRASSTGSRRARRCPSSSSAAARPPRFRPSSSTSCSAPSSRAPSLREATSTPSKPRRRPSRPEHIAVLKRHGIGRVSMGIQSLDPAVLDRVHREQTHGAGPRRLRPPRRQAASSSTST